MNLRLYTIYKTVMTIRSQIEVLIFIRLHTSKLVIRSQNRVSTQIVPYNKISIYMW